MLSDCQNFEPVIVVAEKDHGKRFTTELECGPVPNVMAALSNTGEIRRGKKKKKEAEEERKIETTGQKYNIRICYVRRPQQTTG